MKIMRHIHMAALALATLFFVAGNAAAQPPEIMMASLEARLPDKEQSLVHEAARLARDIGAMETAALEMSDEMTRIASELRELIKATESEMADVQPIATRPGKTNIPLR
ncbi:hypothetical protein [Thalassospira sp.]|uniref:hypothetical protein n=1 Tax=Thalassospira sp. TaxID=1912094 RepID=UPI002735AF1A|nr:hypothetical protein [Thalassospira sp.]